MPKYKVGDVAALFPKPSAPKTTSGQKIQSLFNDFYSKSKKSNPIKFEHKKKEVNNFQKESPANIKSEPKKKKRKFSDVSDSTSIPKDVEMFPAKPKKMKASQKLKSIQDSPQKMVKDEENYFPRNKKKSNSKKFNSSKENSTLFPFNAANDDNSFHFNMADQQSDFPKKKKKTKFQTETTVSHSLEAPQTKKPKKMKKIKEVEPKVTEIDESKAAYTMNEMLNIKHSPKKEKKKKKKERKNKGSDKNLGSLEQDPSSDIQDPGDQNETVEPRSTIQFQFQKAKKLISPSENVFERKIKPESKSSPVVGRQSNKPEETDELISRTLFVGNLPMNMTRPLLSKLFARFGAIETCRLRGGVPAKATIPKKIAAIKNSFHAGQKSCIGYVVFKEEEHAIQATVLNGTPVDDHHIVVNRASARGGSMQYDDKRSVFIGNLPFDVEDEAIWATFAECGEIEAVRVIRDRETGAGKGFGYILFKKIQSKENALAMSDVKISDRGIRVRDVNSGPRKSRPVGGSTKFNAMRRKAQKLKGKPGNKRKSVKKLMNREKIHHEKKKIANIFKKFSAK